MPQRLRGKHCDCLKPSALCWQTGFSQACLQHPENLEAAWIAETEDRMAAFARGEIEAFDSSEVMAELRIPANDSDEEAIDLALKRDAELESGEATPLLIEELMARLRA